MPDTLQYSEAAFFVKVTYRGRSYAYCPYMWVDTDPSLVRGLLVGFPKKLTGTGYSRPHPLLQGSLGGVLS